MKKEIGFRVQQARLNANLTQEELAEKANVSSSFISRLENGRVLPGIERLCMLADVLDVGLQDLLCDLFRESDNDSSSTGGLMLNDDLKEVTVDGEPVKLTPIEYNILLLLIRNQGKVFSIDQIYENIWNEDAIGVDNTVAVHIRHIREKIEINPKEPRYLKVVWGIGYKLEKL